jgi:serine/threonine-protein kinase
MIRNGSMRLKAGTRLGPYEIKSALGAGGMGEVYCARDTKLHRDVAIKVLPDVFAADPDRLARFEREAQLLASLNHPHIAQIYGFEDAPSGSGQTSGFALVMELVDGPTLADRIKQGPIPLDEALPIARQIAEALEAAHARGIIHRDLKPANIKLTAAGAVKVLDFGLAKALNPVAAPLSPAAIDSPAFVYPATVPGVVLGTAAYMSPEQARGLPVDGRADIWALGVVVYEMLAGHRPFKGKTASDTMAALLREDVHWAQLPRETPDELRRLLRRCLKRDPKDRLHHAGDARLIIAEVESDHRAGRSGRRFLAMRPAWLAAGVVALVAALAGVLAMRGALTTAPEAAAARQPVRFAIEPPPEVTNITSVVVAADGRFAVYEAQVDGEFRFFIRRFDSVESQPVAGTEGARGPFLSPDGAWLGFIRNAKLYKVSTSGGEALAVCDVQGGPGSTWDADGTRIIFSRAWLSGLSIVSADGATPEVLTTPDRNKEEIGHWWPAALPGGAILFTIVRATTGLNDARIALLDRPTGSYRVLFPGAKATWLPSGHIVFYRTGQYHAVPFDLSSGTVTGESFPVLDDAQELDPGGDWNQPVSVAAAGVLAYLPGRYVPPSRITWIDAKGTFTPLAFAARPFVGLTVSPDGHRVATASLEAGRLLLRLFDLERGTEELPKIDGMNWNPVWLPDGRLSYTSMRKGDFDVYVKEIGGTGAEHPVLTGLDDTDPIAWTRDGRLVFQGSEPDGSYPLKLFDPRRPTEITRLTEQHVDNGGSISPDERWLAYQSAAIGRSVVYVRPLDLSTSAVALSRDTGEFPVFLHDGKTVALVRGRQLVVRSWRAENGRFEIGPERAVAPLAYGSGWIYGAPYDVTPDGRFLALVRTEAPPPPRIRVVLGWDGEMMRRDPAAPPTKNNVSTRLGIAAPRD